MYYTCDYTSFELLKYPKEAKLMSLNNEYNAVEHNSHSKDETYLVCMYVAI